MDPFVPPPAAAATKPRLSAGLPPPPRPLQGWKPVPDPGDCRGHAKSHGGWNPPGPVVIKRRWAPAQFDRGFMSRCMLKREGASMYTKEGTRASSLNTGGLVCTRGLQRDVVYLDWPIAPSYIRVQMRGEWGLPGLSQWVKLCISRDMEPK